MLNSIKTAALVEPLVAIDDEGGRVQTLENLSGALPSAREQVSTMRPDNVREAALSRGRVMNSAGIDINFAPVVDVSAQPDDEVIGDRSYSTNPSVVITYAGAFADGLRAAGVIPTLKHFPGHGRALGDSHQVLAVAPPLSELEAVDLKPYSALLERDTVVMTGHLDVPGLTEPGVPASMSSATYDLLRVDLGFDGLSVTDDLSNMGAITSRFSTPEAAARALTSGADMVLIGRFDQLAAVTEELVRWAEDGRLPETRVTDALRRVLRLKGCR